MSEMAMILLFAAGLAAMFLELFIPGAIIGTVGFLVVTASVIAAFASGNITLGVVFILVAIAFVPVFFLTWRHVVGRFMTHTSSEADFRSGTIVNESLIGKKGEAISSLRPSGIAFIDGQRHDVVTRGEMLDKGTKIEVIDVTGNRVVVREAV